MAVRKTPQEKLDLICALDKEYWNNGKSILGMDEAGRGPLAGPVVAACVVMPNDDLILGVDDSKKVSEKKREMLYPIIMEKALAVGVGIIDNKKIDEVNILNATRLAFESAYRQIKVDCDIILSDYITGLNIDGYIPITKGDSKSYTIACASIIAKVTRDGIMREYDDMYKGYGFLRHKGYGTKEHREAIKEKGFCDIHRKSFLKNII